MVKNPEIKKEINPVKLWIIIVAVFLLLAIAASILADYYLPKSATIEPQIIQNIFVDINGDGLIDFVSEAKVILNTGTNVNFP